MMLSQQVLLDITGAIAVLEISGIKILNYMGSFSRVKVDILDVGWSQTGGIGRVP